MFIALHHFALCIAISVFFVALDHRWLYPVFDETASEVEVKKIFDYKDEIDKIAKLFDLLSPEFLNINANLCIDVLAIWLSDQEKYDCLYFIHSRFV